MAYFAGNAIYIAHTSNRIDDYEDYKNMCGAGVLVDNNNFEGNIGLKKHNGGAYLHDCIHYDSITDGFSSKGHTSGLKLARDEEAEDTGEFEYYYDDPKVVTTTVSDIFDLSLSYTVLKYATKISNNNFYHNYAGMKGSALAIFKLSEL